MGKLSDSSPAIRIENSGGRASPRFFAKILGIPQLLGALVAFVILIVGWNFLGQFYLNAARPAPFIGARLIVGLIGLGLLTWVVYLNGDRWLAFYVVLPSIILLAIFVYGFIFWTAYTSLTDS